MDITSSQVENIVRKILGEMAGGAPKSNGKIPKTAKVAMLTSPKHIEVKEYEIMGKDEVAKTIIDYILTK